MQQDEKKQIYIGPTIQHMQNSQFLIQNNNNLLLLNKRQLLLLNLQTQSITACKIDSQKVTSTTVHQLLGIYLVKTVSDIFVINQTGELIGKIMIKDEIALMQARYIFLLVMDDGQCEDPHQRIDKMIYITDENLHISDVKVTFERAILKNKRITQFTFELIKKQVRNQIDPTIVFDAPEWIEKCKIFKELGYFVCYNKNEIMVFKLPKLVDQTIQLYLAYKKTARVQNLITDVVISSRQKQIIFSHQSGVIKIYRFNSSKKYLQQLRGHQKQCQSLYISQKNNKDILYSSGYDNTIRIWNLYQFQEIYSLRIDLICDDIILLSDQLAFVKFFDMRKTCLAKINAYKMEPVMTQNKGGKITSLKCDGEWGIALYSNNYAEMFLITSDEQNQLEVQIDHMEEINGKKLKHYIQKIQFPLKYGNVRSAKKLTKNQYAIILQKGFSMITLDKDEIISQNFQLKKLVYNQQLAQMHEDSEADESDIDEMFNVREDNPKEKEINQISNQKQFVTKVQTSVQSEKKDDRLAELIHQKLLGTYLFGLLQDWKGIPTAINVTFVTFVTGKTVPMWDMDQKRKGYTKNVKEKQPINRKRKKSVIPPEVDVNLEEMIHVVLGTDRGVIYIVDIQNRGQFQSRIVMHTGQIQYIKEFFPKKVSSFSFSGNFSDQIFFMSLDRNREFCFWSISEDHPPNIYCRVANLRDISHLSLHDSYLLIGEKEGKISILQIIYEDEKNEESYKSMQLSPLIKKQSRAPSRDSARSKPAKMYFRASKNDSIYGHMKKVTTGDYINYKQKHLFITGSEDCIIKLWLGLEKILLFQLKIFDTIEHMRFLHQGIDFLMAHNNQISVIKGTNIDEIKQIENDLQTKYDVIPYFGFQTISVKSFFMKQDDLISTGLKKASHFRLTKKQSLKADPISVPIQEPPHKTSIEGFGSNFQSSLNMNKLMNIKQEAKKLETEQSQTNFLTKLQEKVLSPPRYLSPEKKIVTEQQKQKKLRVYAKSQQKIKAKKSFHVANTAESKQYNETYFMLPKIVSKNTAGNISKIKPSTSFQVSSFLDQMKSQRDKAFSYFGRYSKK